MAELIIEDQNVKDIGSYMKSFSLRLESALDDYLSIMNEIASEAVNSGEISDTLEAFIQYASKLNNSIAEIGSEINTSACAFIEEVDEKINIYIRGNLHMGKTIKINTETLNGLIEKLNDKKVS